MTNPVDHFLPYARQLVDDEDIEAVVAALRADFLTTGPTVDAFEAALAAEVGSREAVACSSGTSALHLAILALGLGAGERVVVPSVTFLATANTVRFAGGEVVFADIDSETGQMGAEQLEEALATPAGKAAVAVMPVCLGGVTVDPVVLAEAARGRRLVYDACHALGTAYGIDATPGRVGDSRHADMTAFSFHPVKTIAMGEGGAVTTNDRSLADRLRLFRNHGMTRDSRTFRQRDMAFDAEGRSNPWYYEMHEPGYNYRVTDIQCALGLSQLGKLVTFARRRRLITAAYDARLAALAPLVRPLARPKGCDPVLHLYIVRIRFDELGVSRGEVMRRLQAAGIGTQVHYIPVHLQPYYRQRYGEIALPGAAQYYAEALSLPLFNGMQAAEVDRVVDALADVLGLSARL